jgi:ADP-ribose pyrophosphatase
MLDTAPSVMVVPVTEDGEVVLVKQYRRNLKRNTLELPAGVVADGEAAPTAALRELIEATGYALAPGGELHDLGNYYALPAETNKYVHFYLALGVRAGETPRGETLPFEEAFALIGTAIHGLETTGALLLARQLLGST